MRKYLHIGMDAHGKRMHELGLRVRKGIATKAEKRSYHELGVELKVRKQTASHIEWQTEYWDEFEKLKEVELADGKTDNVAINQAHFSALKAVAESHEVNTKTVRKAIIHAKSSSVLLLPDDFPDSPDAAGIPPEDS